MSSRPTRENERNIRANDFLQESQTDFADNAWATEQIGDLAAEIAAVGDAKEDQISRDGDARQSYEAAETASEQLKIAMDDVIDFAVTMADQIDGIEEKFRHVRTGGKRARIARARVFAADALPYKDLFTGRGLESNFIENLNNKADALEQALARAVLKTGDRVGATSQRLLSIKKSSKIVTSLDPVVRKRYRDDPAKLAAWDYASRVWRQAEKPKTPPDPPTP